MSLFFFRRRATLLTALSTDPGLPFNHTTAATATYLKHLDHHDHSESPTVTDIHRLSIKIVSSSSVVPSSLLSLITDGPQLPQCPCTSSNFANSNAPYVETPSVIPLAPMTQLEASGGSARV